MRPRLVHIRFRFGRSMSVLLISYWMLNGGFCIGSYLDLQMHLRRLSIESFSIALSRIMAGRFFFSRMSLSKFLYFLKLCPASSNENKKFKACFSSVDRSGFERPFEASLSNASIVPRSNLFDRYQIFIKFWMCLLLLPESQPFQVLCQYLYPSLQISLWIQAVKKSKIFDCWFLPLDF